ncbi:acyl carrier protein [Actinacidiphila oryziradicis]|uniref:Acyl carrier protein n=1 Tax=Actinacidiphila oryziradicis TaxID=2571141 RepID=A0A4U0RQ62_9ACTN|nr:acyl carrier protein [Actinacidiphila oryziradicis]TJZ97402.1 acyl carrier protein [Actinacidiphila oryziradicis]
MESERSLSRLKIASARHPQNAEYWNRLLAGSEKTGFPADHPVAPGEPTWEYLIVCKAEKPMDNQQRWHPLFGEIVRTNLELGPDVALAADSSLPDLGLDSLTAVNLSVDLEEAFGFSFPDNILIAATFTTVGSLWTALKEQAPEIGDGVAAHDH